MKLCDVYCPVDILRKILDHCDLREFIKLSLCCKQFEAAIGCDRAKLILEYSCCCGRTSWTGPRRDDDGFGRFRMYNDEKRLHVLLINPGQGIYLPRRCGIACCVECSECGKMMNPHNMDQFRCTTFYSVVNFVCLRCWRHEREVVDPYGQVSAYSVAHHIVLRNNLVKWPNNLRPRATIAGGGANALREQATIVAAKAFLKERDPDSSLLAYFCPLGGRQN